MAQTQTKSNSAFNCNFSCTFDHLSDCFGIPCSLWEKNSSTCLDHDDFGCTDDYSGQGKRSRMRGFVRKMRRVFRRPRRRRKTKGNKWKKKRKALADEITVVTSGSDDFSIVSIGNYEENKDTLSPKRKHMDVMLDESSTNPGNIEIIDYCGLCSP